MRTREIRELAHGAICSETRLLIIRFRILSGENGKRGNSSFLTDSRSRDSIQGRRDSRRSRLLQMEPLLNQRFDSRTNAGVRTDWRRSGLG